LLLLLLLVSFNTQNNNVDHDVNAKGQAVQDACLFKQSESREGFSAFARYYKEPLKLKKRSLNYV